MNTALTLKMIFGIVGGLGIFLLGMKNMSEGMQAVAGNRLRKLINAVTNNRLLACGVGIAVTSLIQSSSVTTVMVVGVVNAGLMNLMQAIGGILGANIGTTITGWIPVLKMPDGQARKYRAGEAGKQSTFFLQNGSLKTTGEPNGYLRTEDVYDNYVFHMEVRFSQEGNSGVIIHVQKDAVWPLGIECQLYQAHMGRIFPIRGATLEGGEMIHASSKPPSEWNVYEVYS